MNGDDRSGGPQGPRRRRISAGKASLNRGIAALAVAAAGYILGFGIPWAFSSARSTNGSLAGRAMFFPVGGIVSLLLAIMAISIGVRVIRFTGGLSGPQRERLNTFIDVEKERRHASSGVALGIISIVVNPLLAFAVIAIARL